jgi:mRNA-degrading endonuclease toxin of MazEF toxin-antitoxin module
VLSAGKDSVAVCDQVQVIDKQRIKEEIVRLSEHDLQIIEDSVRVILGL